MHIRLLQSVRQIEGIHDKVVVPSHVHIYPTHHLSKVSHKPKFLP